jgi:hypothetical protein
MPSVKKAIEGDNGFIGIDAESTPSNLEPGFLQVGENIRIEQTRLFTRKGLKTLFGETEYANIGNVLNTSVYNDRLGNEYLVLILENGIRLFSPSAPEQLSQLYTYPKQTIGGVEYIRSVDTNTEAIQAVNNIYILRGEETGYIEGATYTSNSPTHTTVTVTVPTGHGLSVGDEFSIQTGHAQNSGSFFVSSTPSTTQFTYKIQTGYNHNGTANISIGRAVLYWDGSSELKVVKQVSLDGNAADFPMTSTAIFHRNRIYCKVSRDEIAVSDYLTDNDGNWKFNRTIKQFTINEGDGQEITAIHPWTDDTILVFKDRSIYQARIGDANESAELVIAESFVRTLSSDLGSLSKKAVANTGNRVFFLSQRGIYMIEPNLDLRLLTNTVPVSRPVQKYINRINGSHVRNVVSKIFNGRLYIAVPLDNNTENSHVLVYNMINQQWESVDTYPANFDVHNMHILSYNNRYELIYTDRDGTVHLSEYNNYDEYGELSDGAKRLVINAPPAGEKITAEFVPDGNTILPFEFGLDSDIFGGQDIKTLILTRNYDYSTLDDKRFTAAKVSYSTDYFTSLQIAIKTRNPDYHRIVDLTGMVGNDDAIEKSPIGKIAAEGAIEIKTMTGRVEIKSIAVEASLNGSNLRNRR